ncbi:MAG: cupin domain-containing protein [Candidatus Dormibacteria bacterium]
MSDQTLRRGAVEESGGAYVAQADDHQRIRWVDGVSIRILLDASKTAGQLAVVEEVITEPNATPLHIHPADEQTFIVLEGSLRVWVGGERHEVDAGGIAFLPRGIPHAVRVTSTPARLLVLGIPAGEEELFRRAGWDMSQPVPPDWALTPAQVAAAGSAIGHTILGPPPSE